MGTRKIRHGEAVLTSTHNLYFEQKYEKCQNFLSENFQFLVVKFSLYLYRHVLSLFAFMHINDLLKEGLLKKESICSYLEHFFPFRLDIFS